MIRGRHTCTMPPRRTRRGDPEPENRSANRNWGPGPGRGRRVENLGKPPKRVRGGPQPRWPREGPAVRPPAHGCRGRAGRRNVFGRTVGPSGRSSRPGPGHCRSLRRRRATGWIDGGTGLGVPGRSGRSGAVGHRGGTVDQGSLGNQWSSRVRGRSVDGCSDSGSGPDPSGWGPGSSDGTIRRVEVERRSGSEELTGSPGGYSGSLSRFPTNRSAPDDGPGDAGSRWASGHVGAPPGQRCEGGHRRRRE